MMADIQYAQALQGEGEYWDNFIAQRLLRGEIPGSLDWRLNFTQFRFNHDWRPFCLGTALINFRMRELKYVVTEATRRPGMRVLDLGCGAGWLSLELARRGAHVTALDISPTNLAIARYMSETNTRNFSFLYQRFLGLSCRLEDFGSATYEYADLNTVKLPANEYDIVVVWDSLHHVSDLDRLMEQVRGALKRDGVFLGVDHAYATHRTEEFNLIFQPWLDDIYGWITRHDPEWLYDTVNRAARRYDWGILDVDHDSIPILGFRPFLEELRSDLLDIIGKSLRRDMRGDGPMPEGKAPDGDGREEESPFEDVSARRVIRSLLDNFKVRRFRTLGPYIMPEKHIPAYRSEKERIFQHYLAACLVYAGERAIERDQVDGQWFLFHLTPERPDEAGAFVPQRRNYDPVYIARREDYLLFLESEITRKNEALVSLEERIRQRESELVEARKPRLPWKRGRLKS